MYDNDVPRFKNEAPEAERRAVGRLDGRAGENPSATIFFEHETREFIVLDFSALGLGLETRTPLPAGLVRPGARVLASFIVNHRNPEGLPLHCEITTDLVRTHGGFRFGLKFLPLADQAEQEEFVTARTIALPETNPLAGLLEEPLVYDQTCLVRVERLARQFLVLHNADPVLAIFPSLPVVLRLNIFSGAQPVHGQVIWIRQTDHGVRFAIRITDMRQETERGIVGTLMRFLDWPPFRLRSVGFDTSRIKHVIRFRFIQTQQEYLNVLRLRRLAYSAARKLKRDVHLRALYSEHDEHSRILGAYHHDRLIGSVALRFGNGIDLKYEFQEKIKEDIFQRGLLPRAHEIIEVSRLCIHHDYRKSDILIGLFERVFQALATSPERTHIVAACDKYLWPIYESIGFRKTGIHYTIKRKTDAVLDLIVANQRIGAYGADFDRKRWAEVYRGISLRLDNAGLIKKASPRHLLLSPARRAYFDSLELASELKQDIESFQHSLHSSQKNLKREFQFLKQDMENPRVFWNMIDHFLDRAIRIVRSLPPLP